MFVKELPSKIASGASKFHDDKDKREFKKSVIPTTEKLYSKFMGIF
jgi:hypothetical protein